MSRLRWVALGAGAVLVVLSACGAGAWFHFEQLRDRPGPLPEARAIVVPHGGGDQVLAGLIEAGVVADPLAFRIAVWRSKSDGPLRASEFAFPAHASIAQVLTILRTARPVTHRLTIPEGLTAFQVAALVTHAEAAQGVIEPLREGSLLPETYAYEYGTQRSALVARARAAMTRELDAAWADRGAVAPLSSPREALILASIVERETSKPEERPHVASVYLNRLRRGMKLQADPTVVYGASGGSGVLGHKLTRAELDRDDPFNTYRNTGLPPNPICMPGAATLRAVLHPAQTDDLYFVADGSGGHVFAATLAAHERNVLRWRDFVASRLPHGSPD